MLQKEFFRTQSFNPSPYWNNQLVSLSGAQKFDANTVFYPGRYKVVVNAGSNSLYGTGGGLLYLGKPVKIEKEIIVTEKFIIRAYCGGNSVIRLANNTGTVGTNPYVGEFKVNGMTAFPTVPPTVTHIFGNAGSAGFYSSSGTPPIPSYIASSGNCLGNGVLISRGDMTYFSASSAGSCLHFIPIYGVFGTDYLFAFHCAGLPGMYYDAIAGGGSAYGGAGSGGVYKGGWSSITSGNGGSTPYGTGGAGVTNTIYGKNGTGIGNGKSNGYGAGAFFDGQNWNDITTYITSETPGKIQVTYLGPIN